jgi:5-methyltetrahydrofolate corrinoid/iron sulfur protein methyltransferase
LQENFNNVPLALDTANKKAIEAGIKVYNRTNGKPIVNSADAGSRISYIDLAAANDAICIALCSADGIAKDNEERMMWAVKLLQENFNNVPLALDTANMKAIEAGIKVYNRTNGKPIVNSADAGSRIGYIDLAAANDAICIALCSADGIAKDNAEREMHCDNMLERGLSLGMTSDDLWFDPLFLVVKGMQDKQMEVLEAIKMFSDKGLKSTGGLSNNSNGAPKEVRPIMDATLMAMCMMQGLTSAIVNPNDKRLMETIKSCEIFKDVVLYSDSYLEN